jgi:hypothetical protein
MKRKRIEKRSKQANQQQVLKAAGTCPRCWGEKLDFNPRTGKPYALGPECRGKKAETQKLLMRERRRAGLAA